MDWNEITPLLDAKLDPAHVKPPSKFGPKGDYIEAFETHVLREPNGGCWVWSGANNGCGYGKFRGKYAHRISYEMHVGPIPEGMHLDHLCRVRGCVNPDHLEPVTNAQNARRGLVGHHMKNGGAPVGESHPRAKVTDAIAISIRGRARCGVTQREIAREFCVSQSTISQIVRGVTWGHV